MEAHGLPIVAGTEVIRGGPGGRIALRYPTATAAQHILRIKQQCLTHSQYWLLPYNAHSEPLAARTAWVQAFRLHSEAQRDNAPPT